MTKGKSIVLPVEVTTGFTRGKSHFKQALKFTLFVAFLCDRYGFCSCKYMT